MPNPGVAGIGASVSGSGAKEQDGGGESLASGAGVAGLVSEQLLASHTERQQMRQGANEKSAVVALESMNQPGFFLGFSQDGLLVLQQQPSTGRAAAAAEAAGASPAAIQAEFCKAHTFKVLPGLDGRQGSVTFEAADSAGQFVSSLPAAVAAEEDAEECKDIGSFSDCMGAGAIRGRCSTEPEVVRALCRRSCGACAAAQGALSKQQKGVGTPENSASAASFYLTKPLAPR